MRIAGFRVRGWLAACLAGCMVPANPLALHAQLPATRLYSVFPAGAQSGSQVELTLLSGADLEGVDRLVFSEPGISAVQKTQAVEGQAEPQPVANQFLVTVAPEVLPGLYEVRAVGSYGISNPRLFMVGSIPEIVETEPNNALAQATVVAPGSTVNGRLDGALDVDWFRISVEAGQRLVGDTWAERIDSRLDARIELYDPSGHRVVVARDTHRLDAGFDVVAAESGDYLVKLSDQQFAGGSEHFYRLHLGPLPQVEWALPGSGVAGSSAPIALWGRNLPGGSPTDDVRLAGQPLDQVTVTVEFPGQPERRTELDWALPVRPASAGFDGFGYRLATDRGPTHPLPLLYSDVPPAVEAEPNDAPDQAQPLTIPGEVWGQFEHPGDHDHYQLQVAPGSVTWIEVFANRLNRAVNPYLVVQQVTKNEAGEESVKNVAELGIDPTGSAGPPSFDTSTDDMAYPLESKEGGTYRLVLRDLFGESRGDPRRLYRLVVRPPQPDFRVIALPEYPLDPTNNANPWTTLIRAGGTDKLTLVALRRDGFAGEIRVSAEGLPEGLVCPPVVIPAGRTIGHVVLGAPEQQGAWAGSFRLVARAGAADQAQERVVRGGTVVWPGNAQVPPPARLTRSLAASVAQVAPYSLDVGVSELVVPQSQVIELPLKAVRRGDFAGALAIAAVDLPDKVTGDPVTLAADQTEGVLRLFAAPDAAVGNFSVFAQTTTQVPFTKKPDGSDKQNINVLDFSLPVALRVEPGPLVLAVAVPGEGVVKRGAAIELAVTLTRRNGFEGPVTLAVRPPAGVAGLSAAETAVAGDQTTATLSLAAAADATEGKHGFVVVWARCEHGGKPLEIHQPITVQVQP